MPPPPPSGPFGPEGSPTPYGQQPPGPSSPFGPRSPILPAPGYQPYGFQQAATQGTSGMAVASLVCSIVGLFLCGVPAILGVIFGAIGMGQTKDNARPGRGLAIAGLVVGILVVLFWGTIWAVIAASDDGCVHFGTGPNTCD